MKEKFTVKSCGTYYEIQNEFGPKLAMSNLKLKQADGYAFKNLSNKSSPFILPHFPHFYNSF